MKGKRETNIESKGVVQNPVFENPKEKLEEIISKLDEENIIELIGFAKGLLRYQNLRN